MLSFAEQLYIRLHYSSEEEALVSLNSSSAELIAAAAITVDLMLNKRIRLLKDQLEILDSRPTGDVLLDDGLARLASIGSIDREDPEWFIKIANILPFGEKFFRQLWDKGLFHRKEKKGFLGLSKTVAFPFKDPSLAATIFESERAIMLMAQNQMP